MQTNFQITELIRVVFVSAEEYPETETDFSNIHERMTTSEIVLQLSGEHEVFYNDKHLVVGENGMYLLPAGDFSQYRVVRRKHGDCVIVNFLTDIPPADRAIGLEPENAPHIRALFQKMFALWASKQEDYYARCLSILHEILDAMQRQIYTPSRLQRLIQPAVERIAQGQNDEKITVSALAAACGISVAYLNRVFRHCYGMSPKKYMIHRRMEMAAELLADEPLTVEQIAEQLGYSGVGNFSQAFKTHMGVSPTAYRKNCKSSK